MASFLNILIWRKLQKVGGDVISLLVVIIVIIVVAEISDFTNSLKLIREFWERLQDSDNF